MRQQLFLCVIVILSGMMGSLAVAEVVLYGQIGARLDVQSKERQIKPVFYLGIPLDKDRDRGNPNQDVTKKPFGTGSRQVVFSDSNIGLKGNMDLNQAVNIFFQGEWDLSDGSMRDTFVGLQGPWGRFKIGRIQGVFDEYKGLSPISGAAETGEISKQVRSISQQLIISVPLSIRELTGRYDSVVYESPVLRGFSVQAQIDPGSGNVHEGYQLGLRYRQGVLDAGVAHATRNWLSVPDNTRRLDTFDLNYDSTKAYATLSLSRFKFGASYTEISIQPYPIGTFRFRLEKQDAYYLTTSILMSERFSVGLLYGVLNGNIRKGNILGRKISNYAFFPDKLPKNKTHMGIGWDYQLSEGTKVYASYSQFSNKELFSSDPPFNEYFSGKKVISSAFSVGLTHRF